MHHERYPGYHVLDQRGHWDDATRRVVLDRVHNVPPFRHLDAHQQATLIALCARVIPQDWRSAAQRVPIAPWIDATLDTAAHDGFRFDDMPPNREAWLWGLAGLDETARALHGAAFADLDGAAQDVVLETVRAGNPPGDTWQRLPAHRWWIYVALRQITGVYYAHPTAWDEIGFGGPAYPRGYFALNFGQPEPWEVREAPPTRERSAR
ncbi:MAG TPA: gluconate 2-dehydrogenase subunit 3 family protein [Chloroflexota bacterium]|nr:gluconate 2-dehydrogenase subunit 3 family protein [Chloroflexota bacterium]